MQKRQRSHIRAAFAGVPVTAPVVNAEMVAPAIGQPLASGLQAHRRLCAGGHPARDHRYQVGTHLPGRGVLQGVRVRPRERQGVKIRTSGGNELRPHYSAQLNVIPSSSIIVKSSMHRTSIASHTSGIFTFLLFAAVDRASLETTQALSAMACAMSQGSANERCLVLSTNNRCFGSLA